MLRSIRIGIFDELETPLRGFNETSFTSIESYEIRTRTVARTRYDSRGNPYTGYEKEEYGYKKLIVTLKKKEMDEVVDNISLGKESSFTGDEKISVQYRRALEGLKANNVSVIEPAYPPKIPAKPNKQLNLFLFWPLSRLISL